jgi:hypothetical protein
MGQILRPSFGNACNISDGVLNSLAFALSFEHVSQLTGEGSEPLVWDHGEHTSYTGLEVFFRETGSEVSRYVLSIDMATSDYVLFRGSDYRLLHRNKLLDEFESEIYQKCCGTTGAFFVLWDELFRALRVSPLAEQYFGITEGFPLLSLPEQGLHGDIFTLRGGVEQISVGPKTLLNLFDTARRHPLAFLTMRTVDNEEVTVIWEVRILPFGGYWTCGFVLTPGNIPDQIRNQFRFFDRHLNTPIRKI